MYYYIFIYLENEKKDWINGMGGGDLVGLMIDYTKELCIINKKIKLVSPKVMGGLQSLPFLYSFKFCFNLSNSSSLSAASPETSISVF